MAKITINTFHKYMHSETIVPMQVEEISQICEARCAVGKYLKGWYVWEVTTGMAVVQHAKTKRSAVSQAIDLISKNASRIKDVIAAYPVRNP